MEPDDHQVWSHLGRLREAKGDLTAALDAYERATASPQRTYYDHYLKANLLRKQGNLAGGLAELELARQLKTDSVILTNLILIFQIQSGQSETVRTLVRSYEHTGLHSNVDQWLLGAAAINLQDSNWPKAERLLARFRNLTNKELYQALVDDPFFDSFRERLPDFLSKTSAP